MHQWSSFSLQMGFLNEHSRGRAGTAPGPHAFANISAAKLRHAVPTVWMIVMERETERAGFFLVVSAYVDTLYSFIFFTA